MKMLFVEGEEVEFAVLTPQHRVASHWVQLTESLSLFLKRSNGSNTCHVNINRNLHTSGSSQSNVMSNGTIGRLTIMMSTQPACWWWSRESILELELVLEPPDRPTVPEQVEKGFQKNTHKCDSEYFVMSGIALGNRRTNRNQVMEICCHFFANFQIASLAMYQQGLFHSDLLVGSRFIARKCCNC